MTGNKERQLCRQPIMVARPLQANVDPHRARFLLKNGLKWLNGTEIRYMFIGGDPDQRSVVSRAFDTWLSLGIGLRFVETSNVNASILRIGFDWTDGSWSYVGTYNLQIPKSDITMNFGWDLTDEYGMTTALHEIGHALGLEHEHQSSNAGIEWNRNAVLQYFNGAPNYWDDETIEFNILRKINGPDVSSSPWDPDSIMQYEFNAGLIDSPVFYRNGVFPPGTISQTDESEVRKLYPPNRETSDLSFMKTEKIEAASGTQADFIFTAPHSGKFTFNTIGEMDAVLRVSEKENDETVHLAADNDSGYDRNAKLTLPLVKGRRYEISVGVQYAGNKQTNAIIVS